MLVSVIIPTLNEEAFILNAIKAARRDYDHHQVEIIVVDGGSRDETLKVIPPGVEIVQSEPSRAIQMNLGVENSNGEVLVFCHADSQLPHGWREAVLSALFENQAIGGTFQLSILPETGILKLRNRVNFPANWRFMYGDQAQFMTRQTFEEIGGFPEIPIMEDLEMSRNLNRLGKLVKIPLRVMASSRKFSSSKPSKQWLLSLKCVILYLYFGRSADEIKELYAQGAS